MEASLWLSAPAHLPRESPEARIERSREGIGDALDDLATQMR
jgi:hypothetical protein